MEALKERIRREGKNLGNGILKLAQQAGAEVIGVGAVIEKSFEGGRAKLEAMELRVRSLAVIKKMTGDEIIFAEGVSP